MKWLVLSLMLFTFLAAGSISRDYIMDEVDFSDSGRAIAETGIPLFYRSEAVPEVYGLWHPPLMMYLIGISFLALGHSEVAARLVPFVLSLGTVILIYLLALKLTERKDVAVVSCLLYVINPYVIQSSLLLDIDGGLLTFAITLFFYLYLTLGKNRFIVLPLAFAFVLWSKLGSAPLIIFVLFLYSYFKKGDTKEVFFFAIIGSVVFLLTWFGFSYFMGLPFEAPFHHNIGIMRFFYMNEMGLQKYLLEIAYWGVRNTVFWITPFFALLVLYSLHKKKTFNEISVLSLYAVLVFLQYIILRPAAWGFPKYYAPMMPIFSILIAEMIVSEGYVDWLKSKKSVFIGILSVMYFFIFLGDPFFASPDNYTRLLQAVLRSIIFLTPIALATLYFRLEERLDWTKAFVFSCIILTFSTSVFLSAVQWQADYSTSYAYGRTGTKEVAEYVKGNGIIIAPKDVVFYSGERNFVLDEIYDDPEKFSEIVSEHDIEYIVTCDGYMCWVNEEVQEIVDSQYDLKERIGTYKVYKTR